MSGLPVGLPQKDDVASLSDVGVARLHAIEADSEARAREERRGAERLQPQTLAGIAQEASDAEEDQRFYAPATASHPMHWLLPASRSLHSHKAIIRAW
jgi:hypothetical protein